MHRANNSTITNTLALLLVLSSSLVVQCAVSADYQLLQQPVEIASAKVKAAYRQQQIIDISSTRRPIVEEDVPLVVNVTVEETRFVNSFMSFNTRTYNGLFPAPTIRVFPGESFTLNVVNNLESGLANFTNIHTHGLHVSPEGLADNVLTDIPPGESRTYHYVLPTDHPSGTYWYHPHHHGAVNSQLTGMMAGIIIVEDLEVLPPGDDESFLTDVEEDLMLLQAVCFKNCDNKWDNIEDAIVNVYQGDNVTTSRSRLNVDLQLSQEVPLGDPSLLHVLVNGQYIPHINIEVGEIRRLRVVNAISNNMVELVFPCDSYVIATDGMYHDRPSVLVNGGIVIPPGGRADVLLQCTDDHRIVGEHWVTIDQREDQTYVLGAPTEHRVGSQLVMNVKVSESSVTQQDTPVLSSSMSLPLRPEAFRETLSDETVPTEQTYDYELTSWKKDGDEKMNFGVNFKKFDSSFINHTMSVNEIQEWTLSTGMYGMACDTDEKCFKMNHPFHIHGTHFQIVSVVHSSENDRNSLTSNLFRLGEWRDTIPLFRDTVVIRFRPTMVGRTLSHCHVVSHADEGMAQLFNVV